VVSLGERRVVHQFGLADTWDRREEHRETLGRGTPVDRGSGIGAVYLLVKRLGLDGEIGA